MSDEAPSVEQTPAVRRSCPFAAGLGLLILRVGIAGQLLCLHGWTKLSQFTQMKGTFPDPLHIGSTVSLTLAVGAEFFCSILIVLGLLTRWAAIPLVVNMSVAGFVVLHGAPWAKKELAFLYLVPFLTLLFTGGGCFSLDALFFRRSCRVPKQPAMK